MTLHLNFMNCYIMWQFPIVSQREAIVVLSCTWWYDHCTCTWGVYKVEGSERARGREKEGSRLESVWGWCERLCASITCPFLAVGITRVLNNVATLLSGVCTLWLGICRLSPHTYFLLGAPPTVCDFSLSLSVYLYLCMCEGKGVKKRNYLNFSCFTVQLCTCMPTTTCVSHYNAVLAVHTHHTTPLTVALSCGMSL